MSSIKKYTKGEADNLTGVLDNLIFKGTRATILLRAVDPQNTLQPSSTSSTTQSIVPGDERMLYYCPNVCRSLHLVVRLYNCVSLALLLWELLSLSLVSQSVF